MKIAFLHYHLRAGGVTTVIRQQIQALPPTCEMIVLSGEPSQNDLGAPVMPISGIGYECETLSQYRIDALADEILNVIGGIWDGGCDVLHVHNPTLAKNVNFLRILKSLQQRGVPLFLQIHDFAEDGRAQAFFAEESYPADCHYGVINSRDYQILLNAGLRKEGLHLVPNNVNFLNLASSPGDRLDLDRDIILYPIRAIRRKNIGEAIFLSIFFPRRECLAITLPPNSPGDMDSYQGWKRFAAEMKLNVIFEASQKYSFEVLYRIAQSVISTSINEGFGFCFLEPWTAEKALWGRFIPGICEDFINKGLSLEHLYRTLRVPIEWIDRKVFFNVWKNSVIYNFKLFNRTIDPAEIEAGFERIISNGTVDFGLLGEAFQKVVIARVAENTRQQQQFVELNPFLAERNPDSVSRQVISNNNAKVRQHYTRQAYREILLNVYNRVIHSPIVQKIEKDRVIDSFLALDRFSLLKWGVYNEQL